jgi:putative hemolysin
MARGWESKAVESQIESAETNVHPMRKQQTSAEELEVLRKKESLNLSRTRVLRELETTQNLRYRNLMQKALHDLDSELSRLEPRAARAATA